MSDDSTNRELLQAWREGNQLAAQTLVRRYMARLTALARARLSRKLARRLDPEDVVMSAWRSFFAAAGRFDVHVPEDDSLWPLLVTVTLRKLNRQAARHSAARRAVDSEMAANDESEWQDIVTRDPTPDEAALVTDEVERLMGQLSPQDRAILACRLQGEDQKAVASEIGCSERTVRRSLQHVRDVFLKNQLDSDLRLDDTPIVSTQPSGRSVRSVSSARASLSASFKFRDVILEELVGMGCFGRVYRARRRDDNSLVAVKYLRKHLWTNPGAVRLLVDEVTTVSALSHPGIVKHYGWGQTKPGAVFAVMEWIDGSDLAEWQRQSDPCLPDILACGIAVCDALGATHREGILHTDLTLRNVLRRKDGRFVLTDFGLSHVVGDLSPATRGGTAGYLAPEQISDAFGRLSPRTDVFGIGGLLYTLLAGRTPVPVPSIADSLAMTLSSRAVQPLRELVEGVPEGLNALISMCLNKEQSERPASVDEVRQELERIAATCV